jgi:hypothetical protein
MTTITTTVTSHRRGVALAGILLALVVVVVALAVLKTSPAHDLHHLVSSYQHLPHFLRDLLGAGQFGSV